MSMTIDSNKKDKKVCGIERSYFFNLLFFYAVAHGGILLIPNALFWDDWVLYGVGSNLILNTFDSAGAMFNIAGNLHVAMLGAGPWIYKALTFLLMFISGILLWKILERISWIKFEARYLIVLLFLVLPLSSARVAMINFPATLGYFLFFLSWYLQAKSRWLALGFYFLSFNVHSLLVFYVLPMADRLLHDISGFGPRSILKWAGRNIDFMILPFAYWTIKSIFYKPYGAYEGYNQTFTLKGSIEHLNLVGADIRALEVGSPLLIIFVALAFFFVRRTVFRKKLSSNKLLAAGAVAFLCGVLPYWVVGAVPTFLEWTNRHQLLMPLGTALMLVGLVICLPYYWIRQAAYAVVIAVSLTLATQFYYGFLQDWTKQKELISVISKSDKVRNANLVLFEDHTENALRRSYRFYEWNALMKVAFGDEARFGLTLGYKPLAALNRYRDGDFDAQFNATNFAGSHVRDGDNRAVLVKIDYVDEKGSIGGRLLRIVRKDPVFTFNVQSGIPQELKNPPALSRGLIDSAATKL